ncbi:MAG: DinB family protein [Armatimonadetes bacterium]|nr:DinB family protein [Armatimonadota bacterium]
MTFEELIQTASEKNRDHLERARTAVTGVSEWDLNHKPASGDWSPGQIFRHLVLSNNPYLALLPQATAKAPSAATGIVRHTKIGGFIARQAGPGTNAPAPKPMVPEEGTFGASTVEEWISGQERLYEAIQNCRGKDLNAKVLRNPMLKLFAMSLGDVLEILTVHTERHVLQIEERLHHAGLPS